MSTTKKITCPVDAAHELIAELDRNPDIIPLYNAELMQQCIDNINKLYGEIREVFPLIADRNEETPMDIVQTVMFKQTVVNRIKRCCCAYIETRKERLKSLRWKSGGFLEEDVKQNLSAEEMDFFKTYNKQIAQFQSSIGSGINLILHTKPPKKLSTEVRVLKEYGEFETADGKSVMLKKDLVLSMLSVDCERLVKRNIVEYIESASLNS